ncbi:DEAD/DEAH box helicase [Psychromonas sp. GE-S-Ul-11]|uniref:DEAD/DEAH box helicase n=1 Tax=Psychromonas sp. GE-S-Ul-11 TaxID=3241170 RepID=UPI00390C9FE7
MLRQWQQECFQEARKHYSELNKHFLCLATPGAGKTVLASEIAAYLIDEDKIDFVICFSPSTEISNGMRKTFSKRLNCNFDGVIGSIGCSYTYQNMRFFNDDYWKLLRNNRVLVVFDEIHHCAGSSNEDTNMWGEDIIKNIQDNASYTLALTGTPWRSDLLPITLATYSDPGNKIQCNYIYSLQQAVNDGVCRNPKIVLIDNEEISVTTQAQETKIFRSLKALLKAPLISYQDLITHDAVIQYILAKGCHKLSEIRRLNPDAGGLIVASSVDHAQKIMTLLTEKLLQTAVIVTYKEQNSSDKIKYFRCSNTQWIVSVGMVSEGTDIPRLQVCCHLSRVKTELYFRQVLGRILRVNNSMNQEAWLFTFAEEKLSIFANRIEQELPDTCVLVRSNEATSRFDIAANNYKTTPLLDNSPTSVNTPLNDLSFQEKSSNTQIVNGTSSPPAYLKNFGGFREKLIEAFTSI